MSSSPDATLLHEVFDARWRDWRDRIAIDIPPGPGRPRRVAATYAELAHASHLIQSSIQPFALGDRIAAVLLPRTTVAAFAAPIGILRAGSAFMSIDPAFPDERIAELLNDSEAVAVVTDRAGAARMRVRSASASTPIVEIESLVDGAAPAATGSVPDASAPGLSPNSLAYVIYTSGTTGRPKGVMTEHRAIVNLVASDLAEFGLTAADRVGQGSSHAYDSSIEEIWLALASGATVVVMDDDVARAGPDLVPWLDRERITVLCPPPTMFRATGCRDARGLLPRLRLLYVGGEPLTADVVEVWAPGRRLVNGYGPTECAVTCIRADVAAGGPIVIGRPIRNIVARILNDALEPVPAGESGELCLGGLGLARGYWRDPDLTARKFIAHPTFGRLYRTGDLAVQAPDGSIVCLGRLDSQVKIRGHRVELEDIEARLAACAGVLAAACRLQGSAARPQLVAFVVPVNPAAPPESEALRRELSRTLPAHMVPAAIATIDALPVTAGGKVDRARLPTLSPDALETASVSAPRTALESRIEAALRLVADRTTPISTTANFFEDLGGDSLLAAELITELRKHPDTSSLTVRDAYESPTIERLAATAATRKPAPDRREERELPPTGGRPALATIIQTAWLGLELVVAGAMGYLLLFIVLPALAPYLTVWRVIFWFPVLGALGTLLYIPAALMLAVVVKRILIGAYRPLRAPVWGRYYVQHWIVCHVLRIVPWRLLEGTVYQLAALRLLGARVGRRVHIHRGVDLLQGGWDLLEIGDDVTIGQEAAIRLVDLEDEQVVVGPVVIGAGATLETRATVGAHAILEPGGYLTALSSLPSGGRIPAGERWDGVPAEPAGSAPPAPPIDASSRVLSPAAHGSLMLLTRVVSAMVVPTLVAVAAVWIPTSRGAALSDVTQWLRGPIWRVEVLWLVIAAGIAPAVLAVVAWAIGVRLLGNVPAGVISRWSLAYLRVWAKTDLVRRAGDWLSGTLMWPMWLRAAGMRIGRDCEISTIIDVVPELVEIGSRTFLADGIYLGGPRIHRGTVTLAQTRLGSDVFLGNHVVIPAGCSIADGVLIGVCTVAGDKTGSRGSSWFGHPPFALARPPQAYIDPRLTHHPSAIRYVNRWLWEVSRFLIPIAPVLMLLGLAQLMLRAASATPSFWMAIAVMPALIVIGGLALAGVVLALKWILLGRVRPGQHPLWSCWCSRWDFLYVVWGRLARPFLARFDGTLHLAWYLRAMGMRIGRRVVLGSGFAQVVDPDMIQIDDDATVHALFQAHTFEDRILKIGRVRIRRRATVGCGAVLFYGVDVGEGASVAPQSVIMKHERLRPRHRYEGCPSASVSLPR